MATASSKKDVSQENASPKKDVFAESRTMEDLFAEDKAARENYSLADDSESSESSGWSDCECSEELFADLKRLGQLDDEGMYFSYILFSAGLCCLLYMSDNIIGYY